MVSFISRAMSNLDFCLWQFRFKHHAYLFCVLHMGKLRYGNSCTSIPSTTWLSLFKWHGNFFRVWQHVPRTSLILVFLRGKMLVWGQSEIQFDSHEHMLPRAKNNLFKFQENPKKKICLMYS